MEDINVTETFNKDCIYIVWKYSSSAKSWSAYSPNSNIQNIIDSKFTSLSEINKAEGFWIKGNENCEINTTTSTSGSGGGASGTPSVEGGPLNAHGGQASDGTGSTSSGTLDH